MIIPEYLGDIEFLRGHPQILRKLIERSSEKSLATFIKRGGIIRGFVWEASPEKHDFWAKVLLQGNTDFFYKKYPRKAFQTLKFL